ncbi:MAG TPA: transglutaminase domain-containing protein [Candidatus Sulfotelmatobacter sp.]|nr:transglutaminase domain-containing protein [Candidatus Sulfotelmatobacter sp.]
MIAEIIPEAYDANGKQVSQPFLRRKGPHPTFPMGRYVSQPLAVQCKTIEDVCQFLHGCRGVSDRELFDKEDYWQPPEDFEKRKAGDCEDFSLWTWRQLLAMGLDARVVFGRHGRYGVGHAWVMFFQDGKCFLVEPQARSLGLRLPRLSTLAYEPRFSVAWNGKALKYHAHNEHSEIRPRWMLLFSLVPEWVSIWGRFWLRVAVRLPYVTIRTLWRTARGKRAIGSVIQP